MYIKCLLPYAYLHYMGRHPVLVIIYLYIRNLFNTKCLANVWREGFSVHRQPRNSGGKPSPKGHKIGKFYGGYIVPEGVKFSAPGLPMRSAGGARF